MIQIAWEAQATGVLAANGAPTLATDGVNVYPQKWASFIVDYTPAGAPGYQVLIWMYRNGIWSPIIDPPYGTVGVPWTTNIQGDVPCKYADRAYIELVSFVAGDSFDFWWGVDIT